MTLEKTSETSAKRTTVSQETVTIDALNVRRNTYLSMISRLQDSIASWQSRVDEVDAQIAELRNLGIKTMSEYQQGLQGSQGGEAPGGELP